MRSAAIRSARPSPPPPPPPRSMIATMSWSGSSARGAIARLIACGRTTAGGPAPGADISIFRYGDVGRRFTTCVAHRNAQTGETRPQKCAEPLLATARRLLAMLALELVEQLHQLMNAALGERVVQARAHPADQAMAGEAAEAALLGARQQRRLERRRRAAERDVHVRAAAGLGVAAPQLAVVE